MSRAGAIISGGKGTAQEKLAVMETCGIKVTRRNGQAAEISPLGYSSQASTDRAPLGAFLVERR
jgi:succinyl-CoA synthetase alpha subunit